MNKCHQCVLLLHNQAVFFNFFKCTNYYFFFFKVCRQEEREFCNQEKIFALENAYRPAQSPDKREALKTEIRVAAV